MDRIEDLRAFVAVVERGSLTGAARRLGRSLQAVSRSLAALEREIGVEVFQRTSRSVELTAEGRVILDYAHRVIAEVDGLHSELAELTGLLRGQLRIGGGFFFALEFVEKLLVQAESLLPAFELMASLLRGFLVRAEIEDYKGIVHRRSLRCAVRQS